MIAVRSFRLVTVAACSLLAVATSASAECAWVLWQHLVIGASTRVTTEPIDSYTTRQACGSAITGELTKAEASKSETMLVVVDRASNSIVTMMKKNDGKMESLTSLSLVCLPDTIDPRGPKGK